tara:strand:+ start:1217 stop:1936 length:720 start_codon:yes stop_codon:yes gene_type:complete
MVYISRKLIMRCGETDIRTNEYSKKYSDELFFRKMIDKDEPLILDIGAHVGESVEFFKHVFPKCKIHSFEPFLESYKELCKLQYSEFIPINKAVSSKSGEKELFVYNIPHLNSLNRINIDSKDSIHYAKEVTEKKVQVKTITLDDYIDENNINKIDIIKIDVQGSEADVLIGGRSKCLKVTKLVTLEISLFDFYEKKSSFSTIESLLPGYDLYSIIRLSQNPMNFRTDWCETVYINRAI